MISVIVPAHKEPHLKRTVDDLLAKAAGEIEVVVVADGWIPSGMPPLDERVILVQLTERVGMRGAINRGVAASRGQYLMKLDAHCAVSAGYDTALRPSNFDHVLVPTRYRLDVDRWERQFGTDPRPAQYIERGSLKGRDWPEFQPRQEDIYPIMTSQGSCWFMTREFWDLIGGLDEENYGYMGREAQEICLKTWTTGGQYLQVRDVWYAHWDKPKEHTVRDKGKDKSVAYAQSYWTEERIESVIDRFAPVPSWEEWPPVKVNGSHTEVVRKSNGLPVVERGMNRRRFYREVLKPLGVTQGAEVGVHRGRNAWMMLQEIPGLELILVDPYRIHDYGISSYGPGTFAKFRKHAFDRLRDYPVHWIYDYSEAAALQVPDDSLDFVYIDGDHSYSFVMLDIILWSRKVKVGGIIAGHDYYYQSKRQNSIPKVTRAVNDYTAAHRINPWFITDPSVEDKEWGDRFPSWWWEKA